MFLSESSETTEINERRLKKNQYDFDLRVTTAASGNNSSDRKTVGMLLRIGIQVESTIYSGERCMEIMEQLTCTMCIRTQNIIYFQIMCHPRYYITIQPA